MGTAISGLATRWNDSSGREAYWDFAILGCLSGISHRFIGKCWEYRVMQNRSVCI